MARTKGTTNSASKPNTAKVTGKVGRPNQSVAAIKEEFKQQEERQKLKYASASEEKVMKTIRDITKTATSSSLKTTDKSTVRGYLTGNIYSNSNNLIQASRYLYYRSPIYNKMCNLYADMYCLDCRKLTPNYDFTKGYDEAKSLKQFEATAKFLDITNPNDTMFAPLLNMWIEDVSFNLYFKDDTGTMFWRIDPSEAIIDSEYLIDGASCYGFAMDMSKWKNAQRQQLIEWLGSPLTEMYKEYEKTGIKYIHVPAEYSFVLKFRTDIMDAIIPPLLAYLLSLANLNDLTDSQATADELSFYRMIYLPLKVLSGAKNSDDWEITPDLAIKYFQIAADNAIPAGVSSAVIPGDKLETIDFSDSVSDDVNRVENSQQQILGSAGGAGALLNATKAVNNTALINAALKSESAYVLTSVLPQIKAWLNLQMEFVNSNRCHIDLMPVTIYTKEDYRKSLLESCQYGYTYRLAYGTLLGFTERQTLAELYFETQTLKLQELMKYPLQSSYTTSNTGDSGEVGRPQVDDTELSPSGERSRNQ